MSHGPEPGVRVGGPNPAQRIQAAAGQMEGVQIIGAREARLANTAAFVVDGVDSMTLLAGLDLEGICASSGSACSAGSLVPSHVISALGYERNLANSLVRFSLGRDSSGEEVDFVLTALPSIITRAQH